MLFGVKRVGFIFPFDEAIDIQGEFAKQACKNAMTIQLNLIAFNGRGSGVSACLVLIESEPDSGLLPRWKTP